MIQIPLLKKITSKIVQILVPLIVANACTMEEKLPLRIALSSGSENYINWVLRADSTAEIINLRELNVDSAIKLLNTCDGIIFTGGEDVVPAYYGKGYDSVRCESNPERDTLEFALIQEALDLGIPVLGVCRGQQILNVALGGTLIVDIPADHPGEVIHRCEDYTKCFHQVKISTNSKLFSITGADTGLVTTNHHQAIDVTAPLLRIVAMSDDSIPEAVEWADTATKQYFLAVQWHPERMDVQSKLSMPLIRSFIEATREYRTDKSK